MKKLITVFTLAIITACPLASFGQADLEKDPAYLPIDKVLDLKAIPPQVNVNLPRFLLKDAIAGLTNAPGNALANSGMDIADLVKDVKLIRVVVIETSKTNHAALDKGIKALRAELDSKWTAVVSVPENNVGVYAMGDPSGESTIGIAVLVSDKGEAVIVNIVGHVSIAKLLKLAAQSNKLPKDLLKQLGVTNNVPAKPTTIANPTNSTTNKVIEAPQATPKE